MRTLLRALVFTLLAPVVAGAQATTAPGLSPADIAAIRATSDRWVTAVRAGRWEEAAATYTKDAVLRFADAVYEGRAAIQTADISRDHATMEPDPGAAYR